MSNLSSSAAAYGAYLNKVGNDFQFYFNIVQWSIGIPCNIISIIIFARLLKNKTNMGFLYIWQCAIDLSLLLFFLFLFRSGSTNVVSSSTTTTRRKMAKRHSNAVPAISPSVTKCRKKTSIFASQCKSACHRVPIRPAV